MEENIRKRAYELREKIAYYDQLYYEEGISEISDAEYDRLYKEYEEIEKQYPELKDANSPTMRVGGLVQETLLPKFTHKSPLLSIDRKAKEVSELKDFYEKAGGEGTQVIIEPKFDGITCNINYEDELFANAATRGNGYIGDLITGNFVVTDTVYPKTIKEKELEVRGEAVIPYTYFKQHLEDDYSNPRNAVSGILRQLESSNVAGKGVCTIFYDIGKTSMQMSQEDSKNVEKLKEMGFQTSPYYLANTWDELWNLVRTKCLGAIQSIDGFNVLKVDGCPDAVCDGLVIKVNDTKKRLEIGMSEKGPKWAFAYKFKPLQAETVIDYVDWQVGKTGKVTPVANFKEISLGGTKITRATLNNYDYMTSLPTVDENGELNLEKTASVEKGDTIIVERSNDVIPRIVAIKSKASNSSLQLSDDEKVKKETFKEPEICPICGQKLVKVGPLHFCRNYACPQQVKRRLEHFASRDAMNIVGLGESACDQLFERCQINSLEQIYNLKEDDLAKIDAYKDKKTTKLLKAIQASKKPELWRFIYALSIDNVGKKTAKDLAKRYQTIDNFKNATKEELLGIEDIGDIVADSIIEYLEKHEQDMESLLAYVTPQAVETVGDKFAGKTFVITGTLENPRDYYVKLIEQNGGKVSNSVSKKTDVVLVGVDAGSKETKARALQKDGAPIIILDTNEQVNEYLN